jgi:hypothetical protein
MVAAVLIVGELFLRAALGEHVRAQRGFLGAEKDAADALLAATITNVYRQNYVVHPYYGYTMKPLLDGSPFGWKLGPHRLQSFQLHHAVGSPVSAEERDHQRAPGQQVRGAHELAVLVGELERRSQIADLERALGQPGLSELLGGPVHGLDCLARRIVRRRPGLERGLEGIQALLESHRSPRWGGL